MINYLKGKDLRKKDEDWLVVDKDQWTDDQLMKLYEWFQKTDNYGFALSNPKFEYWASFIIQLTLLSNLIVSTNTMFFNCLKFNLSLRQVIFIKNLKFFKENKRLLIKYFLTGANALNYCSWINIPANQDFSCLI